MDLELKGKVALISGFERAFFQKVRPSSLLRHFAIPEEVAAMVTFVASPRSAATNGAALRAVKIGALGGAAIGLGFSHGKAFLGVLNDAILL